MRHLLCLLSAILHLCAAIPSSPGDPIANVSAVIISKSGMARFTILTPEVIRMEYKASPDDLWEDRQTMVVWNRNLPVPPFSASNAGDAVAIDTGAVFLRFNDTGAGFQATTLSVTRRNQAFWSNMTTWTPGIDANNDPGNLFGTFHTLDTLSGWQNMNCSELPAAFESDSTLPYYPCSMGLVSKNGFGLLDDSRSPVLSVGWMASQTNGVCDVNSTLRQPCILAEWNLQDASSCATAGCCWDEQPPMPGMLNLYYSQTRQDHFSDATCAGCGNLYTFIHAQGFVFSTPFSGSIALNLYWNSAPDKDGTLGDNVVSTFPPAQAGYSFARTQGYIFAPGKTQPANTTVVKLWYSAAMLDHFTTAGPVDEEAAEAGNYSLVAVLGYMPWPNATLPNSTLPSCFQRSKNIDWYLFAHGSNYVQALQDYGRIAGASPIPRRHMLGISWSRWGNTLTQNITYWQVESLASSSFPLDTYIFDMNWHLKPQWTGYTWDTQQYPDHVALLGWLHNRGLYTGANLHDAQGVMSFELRYPEMATANGIDPSSNETVAFMISNKTFADSLHNLMLEPLAAEGLDFWWTDFQQGLSGVQEITGITPTMILNYYRFMNYTGSDRRGLIHSRYGGMGGHKFATGFGGDVAPSDWGTLPFMIYFTATAANTLFCWWGHEMMRNGPNPTDTIEPFVRYMQFGAWSPIYTNWGNDGSDDNLWDMPAPFINATQIALADRAQLLPYRYTAARAAYDGGRCPLRPMYHDIPLDANAYNSTGQYMFGSDMIVAPVTTPVDVSSGLASVDVWLPPGNNWIVRFNGSVVAGGVWARIYASILEVPVLVRGGAVVAQLPYAQAIQHGSASKPFDSVQFLVYPGGPAAGQTVVYEDDGVSNGYLSDQYLNTSFTYVLGVSCSEFNVSAVGTFSGMPSTRSLAVWWLQSSPPTAITANGVKLPSSFTDGQPGTWFRSVSGDTHVTLLPFATLAAISVSVCH